MGLSIAYSFKQCGWCGSARSRLLVGQFQQHGSTYLPVYLWGSFLTLAGAGCGPLLLSGFGLFLSEVSMGKPWHFTWVGEFGSVQHDSGWMFLASLPTAASLKDKSMDVASASLPQSGMSTLFITIHLASPVQPNFGADRSAIGYEGRVRLHHVLDQSESARLRRNACHDFMTFSATCET